MGIIGSVAARNYFSIVNLLTLCSATAMFDIATNRQIAVPMKGETERPAGGHANSWASRQRECRLTQKAYRGSYVRQERHHGEMYAVSWCSLSPALQSHVSHDFLQNPLMNPEARKNSLVSFAMR